MLCLSIFLSLRFFFHRPRKKSNQIISGWSRPSIWRPIDISQTRFALLTSESNHWMNMCFLEVTIPISLNSLSVYEWWPRWSKSLVWWWIACGRIDIIFPCVFLFNLLLMLLSSCLVFSSTSMFSLWTLGIYIHTYICNCFFPNNQIRCLFTFAIHLIFFFCYI